MDWIQILVPVLLTIVGGIIIWTIRSKIEESRAIRVKLNEERRNTYRKILSPYIGILTGLKDKAGTVKALAEIQSQKHKEAVFDLTFFGSDNVVRAHNALLQHAYKSEVGENGKQRGKMFMRLWGKLLLEIRKDVGNKKTGLNEFDMLRWLIKDIDKLEYPKG